MNYNSLYNCYYEKLKKKILMIIHIKNIVNFFPEK